MQTVVPVGPDTFCPFEAAGAASGFGPLHRKGIKRGAETPGMLHTAGIRDGPERDVRHKKLQSYERISNNLPFIRGIAYICMTLAVVRQKLSNPINYRIMNSWNNIWSSILSILLGVCLIVWSDVAPNYTVIILGIIMLLTGVAAAANHYTLKRQGADLPAIPVASLAALIFGLLLVIRPDIFVSVVMLILGFLLVIGALAQISALLSARREEVAIPGVLYLFPVLVLIAGIVIIFDPFDSAALLFVIFGVSAVFFGCIGLYNQYLIRKCRKRLSDSNR